MWRLFLTIFLLISTPFNSWSKEFCETFESGPMPVCNLPKLVSPDRVIVLKGALNRASSDLYLQFYTDPNTTDANQIVSELQVLQYSEVNIGELTAPITLILNSREPRVFEIVGRTQFVDQVIVLGAESFGVGGVAVIGIDPTLINFSPVEGFDQNRVPSCGRPSTSCVPQQFFEMSGDGIRVVDSEDWSDAPYEYLRPVAADLMGLSSFQIVEGEDGLSVMTNRHKRPNSENMPFSENEIGPYARHLRLRPSIHEIDLNTISYFEGFSLIDFRGLQQGEKVAWRIKKAPILPGWHGLERLQQMGKVVLPNQSDIQLYTSDIEKLKNQLLSRPNSTKELPATTYVIVKRDLDYFPIGLPRNTIFYIKEGVNVPFQRGIQMFFENPDDRPKSDDPKKSYVSRYRF